MTAPNFYIVADGNAYAIDDEGYMYGAPVFQNNAVDWDSSYEFDPDDADVEYVAHMCNLLKQAQQLSQEQLQEVFVKWFTCPDILRRNPNMLLH